MRERRAAERRPPNAPLPETLIAILSATSFRSTLLVALRGRQILTSRPRRLTFTSSRASTACRSLIAVSQVGDTVPASKRAISGWLIPASAAMSRCESPNSLRSARRTLAKALLGREWDRVLDREEHLLAIERQPDRTEGAGEVNTRT